MTALMPMPTLGSFGGQDEPLDEAELAAAAVLARYECRTLEAYRYGRSFQRAADEGLVIPSATRPQIELYVRAMEARGLVATTVDRRLSTVCGYYRFAHIDGRIASNPAQYVHRSNVHPNDARGLTAPAHVVPLRSRAGRLCPCRTRRALGPERTAGERGMLHRHREPRLRAGHRTLRIVGKGNKPAVVPLVPRTARTIDLAIGERTAGPILRRADGQRLDRRTAHRWVRSIAKRPGLGQVHPDMLLAAFIMCALEAGVRCASADRRASRRPAYNDGLRAAPPELRQARGHVVVAFVAGG